VLHLLLLFLPQVNQPLGALDDAEGPRCEDLVRRTMAAYRESESVHASNDADLVVFDEPSASLDAKAEHELFERVHALSLSETGERIRTTVYVSHRFSTTRRADKIVVIEDGTITEVGPHDELIKLGGRYAEFFNLQAKAFVDQNPIM